MARAKNTLAFPRETNELKTELVAIVDETINSKKRTDEVKELIIEMILLGRKRGRPSYKEEEFDRAA